MARVQDKELRLIGALMYTETDYRKSIEMIRDKNVKLAPLITTHLPLEKFAEAYDFIERP